MFASAHKNWYIDCVRSINGFETTCCSHSSNTQRLCSIFSAEDKSDSSRKGTGGVSGCRDRN